MQYVSEVSSNYSRHSSQADMLRLVREISSYKEQLIKLTETNAFLTHQLNQQDERFRLMNTCQHHIVLIQQLEKSILQYERVVVPSLQTKHRELLRLYEQAESKIQRLEVEYRKISTESQLLKSKTASIASSQQRIITTNTRNYELSRVFHTTESEVRYQQFFAEGRSVVGGPPTPKKRIETEPSREFSHVPQNLRYTEPFPDLNLRLEYPIFLLSTLIRKGLTNSAKFALPFAIKLCEVAEVLIQEDNFKAISADSIYIVGYEEHQPKFMKLKL